MLTETNLIYLHEFRKAKEADEARLDRDGRILALIAILLFALVIGLEMRSSGATQCDDPATCFVTD